MEPLPIKIQPGVVTDATRYSLKGRWVASDKIRFVNGNPQTVGGWEQAFVTKLNGIPRNIKTFSNLAGEKNVAFGTHTSVYVWHMLVNLYNITPIIAHHDLVNAISTTIGTKTIHIAIPGTNYPVGTTIVVSGSGVVGGISAVRINGTWTVTAAGVDFVEYETNAPAAATSTATGGGPNIDVDVLYAPGFDDSISVGGWGTGPWGGGVWGGSVSSGGSGTLVPIRTWSIENWGEDLLLNPNDGPIFYWIENTPSVHAIPISGMPGASEVPLMARRIVVTDRSRVVMAFATNPIGGTNQDPMLVRWCDNENFLEWNPTVSGSAAGELRLSSGSVFVAALAAPSEILCWTDTSLYTIRETANNEVFAATLLTPTANIAGPNAAVIAGDAVFWYGLYGFFRYAGSVQQLPCPVEELLLTLIDKSRINKVFAAANAAFNEVMWFFVTDKPIGAVFDEEPSVYVKFNHVENVWDIGTMYRTAWADGGILKQPIATRKDGRVINHEVGFNDAEENVVKPIKSFIQSGPVEMDEAGYHFITARALIPDVMFLWKGNVPAPLPAVSFSFDFDRFPGNPFAEVPAGGHITKTVGVTATGEAGAATPLNRVLVTPHSVQERFRGRGRSISMMIEGGKSLDYGWRLGQQRVVGRPDGRK